MKKIFENKQLFVSLLIFIIYLLIAILGEKIAPYDPYGLDTTNALKASSAAHIFGTDEYGRDVLSRILVGIRPTLVIAFSSTLIAAVAGTLLGMLAGFSNRVAETVIMKSMNIILCFPAMLLAIIVVAFWGSGIKNLSLVIGVVYIPTFARLAYGATLKIKSEDYIEAQTSLGAGYGRILFRGIFPNILSSIIVQISLTFGNAIILESGLSFLGMGIVPPTPSLGAMVGEAKGYMAINFGMLAYPAIVLAVLVLSVNLIGDGLRDMFDPRLHRQD